MYVHTHTTPHTHTNDKQVVCVRRLGQYNVCMYVCVCGQRHACSVCVCVCGLHAVCVYLYVV